jgi:hypothetical protein
MHARVIAGDVPVYVNVVRRHRLFPLRSKNAQGVLSQNFFQFRVR